MPRDPRATKHVVEHDLLFRWAVECLAALGMQFEHALIVSQSLIRTCVRQERSEALRGFLNQLTRLYAGTIAAQPAHTLTSHSEQLLSVHVQSSNPILAFHDGFEFARHAAVLHGWGAFDLAGR